MVKSWSGHVKKVEIDGHIFDSGLEAKRYGELKLLQAAGEIRNLEVHTKHRLTVAGRPLLLRSEGYPNGRKASWTDDFSYEELRGLVGLAKDRHWVKVVEDAKGYDSPMSRMRRAVFEAETGLIVRLVRK